MNEQTRQANLFIPALIIFGLLSVTGCNSKTEPAASAPNQAAETSAAAATPQAATATEKAATAEKTSEKTEHKAATEKRTEKRAPTRKVTEASTTEKKSQAHVCADCGTITAIHAIEQAGEGSGLGAIAGGVAGAVLGHQVGGGTGKDIATIAGAAGGAYAGHQIEKKMKKTVRYDIVVKMENGQHRTVSQKEAPAIAVGDKVKIVDGMLQKN